MKDFEVYVSALSECWKMLTWPGRILLYPFFAIGFTLIGGIIIGFDAIKKGMGVLFIAKNYR